MEVEELIKVLRDVNKRKISERKALQKIKEASPLDLTIAEERILEDRDLDEEEEEVLSLSADNLGQKEKHHKKEEELLFPRVRKKKINLTVEDLVYHLSYSIRRHVFQENVILYPAVVDEISDWDVFKSESNKIGYCKFTDLEGKVIRLKKGSG